MLDVWTHADTSASMGNRFARCVTYCKELQKLAVELADHSVASAEPTLFRQLQVSIATLVKRLLLLGEDACAANSAVRHSAFESLTKAVKGEEETLEFKETYGTYQLLTERKGGDEIAALIAASGYFDKVVLANLQPVEYVGQQEEHFITLHLANSVAAAVPEAHAFTPILPYLLMLAADDDPVGYPPFHSVWCSALETLVSLSYAHNRRQEIAARLTLASTQAILSGGGLGVNADPFTTCLLCANLCDLSPADAARDGLSSFGDIAASFWVRHCFAEELAMTFKAILQAEGDTDTLLKRPQKHHSWKLATVCMRLALSGRWQLLGDCLTSLIMCVCWHDRKDLERREPLRAGRVAAVTLRAVLEQDPGAKVRLLALVDSQADELFASLSKMRKSEPSADDLLDFFTTGQVIGGVKHLHNALES